MTTKRFHAPDSEALDTLYGDVAEADLQPLWMLDGLMTPTPAVRPRSHVWRWAEMRPLAQRCGELVGISRGGDRRVLSLTNPSLGGRPYATSTLWGAVQYLQPGEVAPAHRHTPGALRFVLEGSGVWTRVEGDAVAMAPGDLVLTPSWVWHEHHNSGDEPMIWFDGLDQPLIETLDAIFFEPGPDANVGREVSSRSRSEELYAGAPGLVPVGERPEGDHSPLFAYRWADTDRALDQLLLADPKSAVALRFADPTTGRDVMPTMRCEMHRLPPGAATAPTRIVGSSIFVVFAGSCTVNLEGKPIELVAGDMVATASWDEWWFASEEGCDLFRVSDAPVIEALGLERRSVRPSGGVG
jgi:gentisate 1,2-dioxygenase